MKRNTIGGAKWSRFSNSFTDSAFVVSVNGEFGGFESFKLEFSFEETI